MRKSKSRQPLIVVIEQQITSYTFLSSAVFVSVWADFHHTFGRDMVTITKWLALERGEEKLRDTTTDTSPSLIITPSHAALKEAYREN